MPNKYFKLGDPNTPQGLKLYTKDSDSEIQNGIHGEIEITKEEYEYLRQKFSDPLTPKSESGGFLTPEAAQKLYEEEDEDIRLYEEEQERRASFFARKFAKEMELGIISKEDIPFYISINLFSSELRKRILEKLNVKEV